MKIDIQSYLFSLIYYYFCQTTNAISKYQSKARKPSDTAQISFRSIMANNIKPKGAEEALFNCMHIKFKTGYEFYGYNIQDFLFRSPP